jgi:hypothetical protein
MRGREVQSFRINPKIWKDFKQEVTQQGFSTCFIIETLLRAYLNKQETPQKVNKSSTITINQHIDYNVKKSRRTRGGPPDNCYDKKSTLWIHKKPDSKEDLNPKNGHHISCECSSCRPYVPLALRSSNRSR